MPAAAATRKEPASQSASFWKEKGNFILFAAGSVVAGLAVFLVLYRAAQRKPQPSFISQSIDKHLR
jgi:anti-sigma-K factor RskA